MVTVSSININTGRYGMVHMAFYIPVSFAFNLLPYATSCMHHTGKKESKKEKERKKVTKNLLQGDSNPDPPNTLELKGNATIYRTTSVRADNSRLKEVYVPSIW